MTQEEKQLLFIDLCARLPYMGFMVRWHGEDYNIINIGYGRVTVLKPFMSMTSGSPLIEKVKPYLRSMSTMTEEEFKEYHSMLIDVDNSGLMNQGLITKIVDWLDKKMFDHRNLISKGLALEAKEGMY